MTTSDDVLETSSPSSEVASIDMTGIVKSFGPVRVLDQIDVTLRAGEIHALMGENGAGKSTLIKILSGDLRADGGSIRRNGEPVQIHSVQDARRHGIAVVHQELSVIPTLSVAENLFLGRELTTAGRMDRRHMSTESRQVLARLGLSIDPATELGRLDIAERQVVEICRALAEDASVLILDEPTAALTETERLRLFTLLERLRDDGLAILYVSHHLTEIERLADRVTVLRNGSVVLAAPKDGLDSSTIVHAMLGERVEEFFPVPQPGGVGERLLTFDAASYGRRVKNATLNVDRGEVVGVTGLLGSGHREVGRLAAGSLTKTGGRLEHHGRVVRFSPGDRKEEGLALGRPGTENLTVHVLRNISRNLGLRYMSRRRENALSQVWAERLGIAGNLDGEVRLLSGGNQQKILVGRNLDGTADLLVLEEPTRGVDVGARHELYRHIRAETDRGAGALVVSTDLREIAGLCDRVVVLDKGEIVGTFAGDSLTEEAIYDLCHSSASAETAAVVADDDGRRTQSIRSIVLDRSTVPWFALLALMVLATVVGPSFLSGQNLQNVARQSVTTGLAGLAQLSVVLAGHIDLSIGAIAGLANLVSTEMLMAGVPPWLVIPLTLLLGALIGVLNATVVRLGVSALLATFAMSSILRGVIAWRYPNSIGPVPKGFTSINGSSVAGVPTEFLLLILLFAAAGWVLRNTRFGLHLYAVGGDSRSSKLSGVRTHRVVLAAFVCSGVLSALAGLQLSALTGAGLPNSGTGLELDAIAVVMIGGASILGGSGTARGLFAGVGIVVVLSNVMNLADVDAFYQDPIKGLVIIVVASIWALRQRAARTKALLGVDGGH